MNKAFTYFIIFVLVDEFIGFGLFLSNIDGMIEGTVEIGRMEGRENPESNKEMPRSFFTILLIVAIALRTGFYIVYYFVWRWRNNQIENQKDVEINKENKA